MGRIDSQKDQDVSAYGLEHTGSTVVLLTTTSIRHYFTVTDQAKFDAVKDGVTFNGKHVEPVEKGGKHFL